MQIVIIFALAVFATLTVTAWYFYYRWTVTKGKLFGAKQDLVRLKARHEQTAQSAQRAEQGLALMREYLTESLGNTKEALAIGSQISDVGKQLNDLSTYLMHPLDELPQRGRHAMPANAAVIPIRENVA